MMFFIQAFGISMGFCSLCLMVSGLHSHRIGNHKEASLCFKAQKTCTIISGTCLIVLIVSRFL